MDFPLFPLTPVFSAAVPTKRLLDPWRGGDLDCNTAKLSPSRNMGAPSAIAESLPANDCWRLVGYKCELLHAWRASAMALPTEGERIHASASASGMR